MTTNRNAPSKVCMTVLATTPQRNSRHGVTIAFLLLVAQLTTGSGCGSAGRTTKEDQRKVRRQAVTSSASFPIGKYRLDMSIDDLSGLAEFSQAEYAAYGRHFEGEKGYNAPGVEFVKRPWKVALGTVRGKVYKIALYFESENKNTVIDVSTDVMQYCQQRLGKPSEQQETIFIWDTPDGNVVLQFGKAETTYMINLFITSKSVRTLLPKG